MGWQNFFTLAGGLGLFLYGMKFMGDELERAAGKSLRNLLEVLTRNRFLGLLVGLVFTMLIQSSSATSVMVIGFVNAGLMNMYQACGVLLGANIGTTITAQLIAFKLSDVAPVILLIGAAMYMFIKKTSLRQIGGVVMGFGMLFVGLDLMSDAMAPLKDMPEVAAFMSQFSNPVLGILVGVAVTALIQSSSASVGILQVLAAQGTIGLDAAVFVILGQNIGTTVTGLLAAIGTNKTAVRTAVMNLLIKVIGAVLFYVLLQLLPMVEWVAALSPNDPMRQIANAHMFYNILNVAVLFPFANQLVRLSSRLVPGVDKTQEALSVQYLNDSVLGTPPAAILQAIKEINRMQRIAYRNIDRAMTAFLGGGSKEVEAPLEQDEGLVDYLSDEITKYLIRIAQNEMQPREANLVGSLHHVVNDIERIGDHAENILEYAMKREEDKVSISEAGISELSEMYGYVKDILTLASTGFDSSDNARVDKAYALEAKVDEMQELLTDRHIERLNKSLCTPVAGMLFTNIITNLERVADHAINIVGIEDKA